MALTDRTRRTGRGFTLVEMLVVMAILAVLVQFALPTLSSAMLSNKLASYANSFSGSVQLAKTEAIKRNAAITLCRTANGTSCATTGDFQQGWMVFRDVNGNGTVDSTDTLLQRQQALSADYKFTGSTYTLSFQPTGVGATAVTLTLCRALPTPGDQKREISVTATARVSITRASATTCS